MKKIREEISTGKLTVMVFQLEGADGTLQEGLRDISEALRNVLAHRTGTRTLPASTAAQLAAPVDNLESPADEDAAATTEATTGATTQTRVRGFRSPQIVDIDLKSGDEPLEAFLSAHDPQEVKTRYLLVAYWLKKHRQLEEVTPDHIHTCFRHMGWETPRHAAQPLRDMKSKDQWFHKGQARGAYQLNHVGENAADRILKGE